MWTSSLFWKLFFVYCGLTIALSIGFFVAVGSWQRAEVRLQIEHRLHDTALLVRRQIGPLVREVAALPADERLGSSAQQRLQELIVPIAAETGSRLTIVGAAGRVWAESAGAPSTLPNLADRAEIQQARQHGVGKAIRQSAALGLHMQYLAMAVDEAPASVRVASELTAVQNRVSAVRQYLGLFACIVGLVAAALTYGIVGRIVQPISDLTLAVQSITSGVEGKPVTVSGSDEMALLAKSFNTMQAQLRQRVEQLRENHERLSTVLSSMEEGVIAVDADEKILFANEASRRLLESGPRDEAGRPLLEASRSDDLLQAYHQCLQTGRHQKREFELGRQRRRVLALRASRLPGSPPPGVVIVLHDVSELRRLENLRHEFVANVSHELKTPLAAIMAYAETLRRGAVNDQEHNLHFVERIEEQATRLHQLILDILQIARIEAQEEAFESVPIPLIDVLTCCVEEHQEAAQRKGVTLVCESRDEGHGDAFVLGDEDGLRTIFDNLIGNAIKYTPHGGTITAGLQRRGEWVVVTVRDTGIGIAEADQARVFERFFRADKARSRAVVSTGLGLSIVHKVMTWHGGSVAVDDSPELGGARFTLLLPRRPLMPA
jgi:two-component system phosphate regulon sensor histidine kinase PhoR